MKRREASPAHDTIAAIRNAALLGLDGLPTESGPMFQCILDMSYLIWQRAINVRTLVENQVSKNAIRFKPSKAAHTSVTAVVQFKDLRALGATDAARTGTARKDIQTRLAHNTTAKTTEIYIKEAIPELSSIDLKLPW